MRNKSSEIMDVNATAVMQVFHKQHADVIIHGHTHRPATHNYESDLTRIVLGDWLWEVPAGKLDGDTPEVCAIKELEEEAGRRAGRLERLGSIWTTPGFTDEVIHLFAAFDLEPIPQRLESDEVIEVVPTPIGEALELIWSGELRDAKSVVALIHAARRIGLLR